jgi:hypothetical protein
MIKYLLRAHQEGLGVGKIHPSSLTGEPKMFSFSNGRNRMFEKSATKKIVVNSFSCSDCSFSLLVLED